jgi:aspartyl-tRNA(Asn)/glutamyl-tRNA(Gln) amidotransferase subunit C
VKLTAEVVERVARLARLSLSPGELDRFARQLGDVLAYMECLNQVDTDQVAPMSHVVDLADVLRDDLPEPSLPAADAIGNAPRIEAGLFMVPPVIEQEGPAVDEQ